MTVAQRPGRSGPPSTRSSTEINGAPGETSPLLASQGARPATSALADAEHGEEMVDAEKPIPKLQIFLLCYARLVEPMAFFSIFPYVNQMAQKNGHLPDADVGFYSGLIESLFSLTQAVFMLPWGRAADHVGRKPVLVFSLFGVTIATGIFGMARTIWQMILFRCAAGVFAGTIVTIRTMLAEHSTPKTQARVFSWFAFSGNLGMFIGPLLGGALADPAQQYPSLFGNIKFFHDYPYALASFVIAIVGATAAAACMLFVTETLQPEESGISRVEQAASGAAAAGRGEKSSWQIVKSPGVGMVLYVYGHVMLLAFAYTAIVPLFWFTPVPLGGYGFTYLQISLMMGVNGAAQAIWLLLIFPPLQHRLGTNGVMRACGLAYPLIFILSPLGNAILRVGTKEMDTFFWIFAPTALTICCGVSMSFTAIQLALNDITPSPQVLGTLNALALTGVSVLRAFCPALFTSLFALGARTQWLRGYAIWLLLVLLALGFAVAARYLPDPKEAERRREAAEGPGDE